MTNPLVGSVPPQHTGSCSAATTMGQPLAPRARATSAAAPTSNAQTAALFQTALQNSLLQSIMAINDTSSDDAGDGEQTGDDSGLTSVSGMQLGSTTATNGVDALGGLASLAGGGGDATSLAAQLQALLGGASLSTGAAAATNAGASVGAVPTDPGVQANAQTVASVATKLGVDPVAAVAMMLVESGGNAHAVGDGGTSFGLFQLHEGGMLTAAGLTSTQAFDPATNARVSLTSLKHQYDIGPRRTPGEIAAASQRPADAAGYARRVDAMMDRARALLGGAAAVSDDQGNRPSSR